MTPTYETWLATLPWDSNRTTMGATLSGIQALSSTNYVGRCVICCASCTSVVTYRMRDTSSLRPVPITDVCASCHEPMYLMCESYMHDSPSSTVFQAVRAVGRSLLIAINLSSIPPDCLRTNVSTMDPTACEWCHHKHHDHTPCKAELLWTLVNVGPTGERVALVRYLPLVHDTQKIIVRFLFLISDTTYTPRLVGYD